jgi:hypothetical protein
MPPGLVSQVADCRSRRSNHRFLDASASPCGVPVFSLELSHELFFGFSTPRVEEFPDERTWSLRGREKLAGWVARTRPLAEPLSPRGPQPVPRRLQTGPAPLNGPPEPANGVRESWYALFAPEAELSLRISSYYIKYLFSISYRKGLLGIYVFLEGFVLLVPSPL